MMRIILTEKSFMRTVLCIFCIVLSVEALFMPICEIDKENPALGDVITLTCKPNVNDSRENITLTWFHDGHNISTDQRSGTVRVKLSSADYGVSFSCREVDVIHTIDLNCTLMPLPVVIIPTPGRANAASSEPPSDYMSSDISSTSEKPADKRQDTIMILFIAIVAAGGLPILLSIIGCIIWVSRKTKRTRMSYNLQERPRSDSFDDFDTEAAVDNRPAAPLPGEVQAINMIKASSLKGSRKNGTPSVLKSLTEKEAGPEYYAPPKESGSDSLYQNTAMGSQKMSSTLPLNTTSKNVYLVPNCNPSSSTESLGEDKIYENTPSNKHKRFEADQTASLPNVRY